MRIVRVDDSVRPPSLVQDDAPLPRPGRGELLIRVSAAGVILAELSWYPTFHRPSGEARTGAVPSHEFSGVVEAVGEEVGHLGIGREVFGMNDWYCDGALAEYCVAPHYALVPKPACLSHAEAASVPISALTAWQGLFDHAKVRHGEHILIHGGAGAVGIFAIQLARIHGAHVIATASARNCEFVAGLGAGEVIDYRESRFEECVKDVDVVFDTVGGETLERSWSVLKPGGRMVTVASTAADSTDPRVKKAFFIVEPNQHQLYEISALLDAGLLRTVVDTEIPLSQAPAAYAGGVQRQGRGKLVVAVVANGHGKGKGMTTTQSATSKVLGGEVDLSRAGVDEITSAFRPLLADVFSLYLKTKNFHWHMTGRHFRDYHLLLDEHAEQIFAMTDDIAERARKIGGTTLHSIGDIARHQRLKDNDDQKVGPRNMLMELRDDNSQLTRFLRAAHEICARNNNVASTSLIEVWIDQTERRTWFLTEIVSEF